MRPQQFEIYVVRVRFGQCNDLRPCLIVQTNIQKSKIHVALLSSQGELFNRNQHMWLEPEHDDFHATGLTRRSYICSDHFETVEVSQLHTKIGCLKGELLDEFKYWWGL